MDPGFVPIAGGADQVASYSENSSQAKGLDKEEVFMPIASNRFSTLMDPSDQQVPLTAQKRAQLATNDKASEQLAHYRVVYASSVVLDLDAHRFKSWEDVISSSVMHLAAKVVKAEEKAILWLVDQERQRQYLLDCWRNLKREFHLLCEKIEQGEY